MDAPGREEPPAEITVLFEGGNESRGPSILIDVHPAKARKPKPTKLSEAGGRRPWLREDLQFGAPLELINGYLDQLDGALQASAQLDDPVGRLASRLRRALRWLAPRVSAFLQDVAEFRDAVILALGLVAAALLPLPDLQGASSPRMPNTLDTSSSGSASTSNFPEQLTMSDLLEDDDWEGADVKEWKRDLGDGQNGPRHRGSVPSGVGPQRQLPTDSSADEYASVESSLRRPARFYPPPARCKRDLEAPSDD